ncbi:MAG: hypothetical protein KatS3mg043_0747 [Rhodothermaceae bacterium]|nr:MAG: hypothetical protein KatS3mg043_0747 [Rhodothermaceae bacterium]
MVDPSEAAPAWEIFLGRLARIAARACRCPVSVVTLVDASGRHQLAACAGVEPGPEGFPMTFAGQVLAGGQLLARQMDGDVSLSLAGQPEATPVRFAAGLPIRDRHDRPVGTLCLFDTRPRTLSGEERFSLHDLAHLLAERLEERQGLLKAEAETAVLRAFYEDVLNELPVEVEVFDPAGRYVWANRAVAPEERLARMIGKTPLEYGRAFGLDDALYRQRHEWIMQVVETGEMGSVDETVLMPDGTVRHMLHVATPVRDAQGHVHAVIGYRIDQSEARRYQQELIAAKEQAEALSRLKSALLANMNHEVRTPLTSIIGFADILQQRTSGENREFAELIRKNGRRLMDTLNAVLDMAQLESGTMKLRPSFFELNAFLLEVAAGYRQDVERQGLWFRLELPDIPVHLFQDYMALQRALSHLLANATKFTSQGGVTLRSRAETGHVCIEIEDTGIGMQPAFLEQVFEAFRQESDGIGRHFDGMGLGLTITRSLLALMGGTIAVESEKGTGSCFRIHLPYQMPGQWVQLDRLDVVSAPHGDGAVPVRERLHEDQAGR